MLSEQKSGNEIITESKIENNLNPNKEQAIQIVKRTIGMEPKEIETKSEKKEYPPRKSLHQRLLEYDAARERIFGPKSTPLSKNIHRIRKKARSKKIIHKAVEATTLCTNGDLRPYAEVTICGETMLGLLDSGASISCLGQGGQDLLKKWGVPCEDFTSKVKTADGKNQAVEGKFTTSITYKGLSKDIEVFVVPSLKQPLYLGINFWLAFSLAPQIISEIVPDRPDKETYHNCFEPHELTIEQSRRLQSVIKMFPSFAIHGLGRTTLEEHYIDTGDAKPIKQRHYPVSPAIQELMFAELDRMMKMGIIQESNSAWSSPVVLVRKPGKNRLCLDYRKVNAVSKNDAYPLHPIEGLLSRVEDAVFISSIDLKDAFLQIPLEKSSREKTAFTVPGKPLLEFVVMPPGLSGGVQRMCRLMDKVMTPELKLNVFPYVDDLLVISRTFDEHIKILMQLASRLSVANLTINVEKSKFCYKELKFLGYVVSNGCLKTDKDKVAAIRDFPVPTTPRQVRRFLGMSGWYRRFIRDFATLATPITNTLKKGVKFEFGDDAVKAFEILKDMLTTSPVLVYPDFSKPFVILCDASDSGIGCVLCQLDENGVERPIYFYSHKLNGAQRNYSVTERECLAAVMGVAKFRQYIEGYKFKIITDHASLKWLMGQQNLSGRLARWSLKLQGYDFEIEHRKGSLHVVPDALSRVHSSDAVSLEALSIDPSDVLHIDLTDSAFKSDEYLKIIDGIEKQKHQLPDLLVSDGFVYKKVNHSTGNPLEDDQTWKLWVPSLLTDHLISLAHQPAKAAHGGIAKTLYRLRQRFFWPNMASQVKTFLNSCETCKTSKSSNRILREQMGKAFTVDYPFQHLYVDFLGPYPRSKKGNTYIIIALDQLTKFVTVKALRNATSEVAIQFLHENIFCLFGVPESLMTDNGKQFTSASFTKYLESLGIRHIKTASYAPQANASERVNRSILTAIRSYLKQDQRDWDTHLPAIGCALRTAVHSAIGVSPYEALFGQKMIEHGSDFRLLRKLGKVNSSELNIIPRSSKINMLHAKIKEALEKAHSQYEHKYNTRSKATNFKVGDVVYRRNFILSDAFKKRNAKLCPKFLKAKIVRVVGNHSYELENEQGQIIGVFHSKDLKE